MLAFDRLVSLFLYFLAAMSIADIMGLQLRSLLAVGGVSGIPNFQSTHSCIWIECGSLHQLRMVADKLKMLESHKCSMLATGLAVGLAAKELVSNFIGGALIFLGRPFVIGEMIEVLKTESMYLSHVHTFQVPVVRSCLIAAIVKYGRKCGRTLGFQVSDFDCVDGWCT